MVTTVIIYVVLMLDGRMIKALLFVNTCVCFKPTPRKHARAIEGSKEQEKRDTQMASILSSRLQI